LYRRNLTTMGFAPLSSKDREEVRLGLAIKEGTPPSTVDVIPVSWIPAITNFLFFQRVFRWEPHLEASAKHFVVAVPPWMSRDNRPSVEMSLRVAYWMYYHWKHSTAGTPPTDLPEPPCVLFEHEDNNLYSVVETLLRRREDPAPGTVEAVTPRPAVDCIGIVLEAGGTSQERETFVVFAGGQQEGDATSFHHVDSTSSQGDPDANSFFRYVIYNAVLERQGLTGAEQDKVRCSQGPFGALALHAAS
jgi:hypothetical protein